MYRYLWDDNALMHEWFYEGERRPRVVSDELGMLILDQLEPVMMKASSPHTII